MLVRRHPNDEQELRATIHCDYHKDLFSKVQYEATKTEFQLYCSKCHLVQMSYNTKPDTEITMPLSLLVDEDTGSAHSALFGFYSDLLKQDLRLPQEDGEVRFVLGESKFGDAEYYPSAARYVKFPRRCSFAVIDDPANVNKIDSIMVIRKRHNSRDEETICGWAEKTYGDEGNCLKYERRVTATYDNFYWEFLIFPIGFRFLQPERTDGLFCWEEKNQSYRTYARFMEAHKEAARAICKIALEAYRCGDSAETPAPVEMPRCADLERMSIQEFCQHINARIATLRTYEGLQNLESYAVTDRLTQSYLTLPASSNAVYTMAQAERRIAQFERLVKLRDTYEGCYKMLEPDIKAVCGHLSTTNVRFAEIEVPARHSLPGEKIMETHQFGYTPQGLREADTWLTKERTAFDEGCVFIQQRFGLQLQDDGTLQPIPGEVPKE